MATDRVGADAGGALVPLTTVEEVIRHRLTAALGGWRGSLETALPTLAFVVPWVARSDLRTAVVAAVAVTVVLAVVRLAQRQSTKFVLQAVVPTVVAAVFALRSGRAEDAFLPGILWNAVMGVVAVVSVATRWPLVGFMVAAGDPDLAEDPLGWRRDRGLVRVCQRLTLVLVAIFAVRLAVMVPLYLAGAVAALGVAKIVLGWPLWLGAVAVMGVLLVRGHTPQEPAAAPAAARAPHHAAEAAEHGPATDTESAAR
ncbi:DUF3159 domain-containing protein [Phycicoccus sp. M110.8]|uniref:DUF3159 domain-containing protein n=1 Tax=Phycicoccus sp. M110.8 TaxID=3075433 RepID=UPI0028FD38A8|nr:DUF3159 domain-containing protein [Phycicoccus sp. M110.8]MDU0315214.1 DUF3159 domain-containing protein [Phycicoccus sp. M110.8]